MASKTTFWTFLNFSLYDAITPSGTPIAKHKTTETKTEERVIIEWDQIPQAPMNISRSAVMKANLKPTVKYPIAVNIPIIYHQGIWVKNVSSGLKRLR